MLNLVDKKFGRLVVIKEVERLSKYVRRWLCRCECGKEVKVQQGHLTKKHTRSCGCLFLECRVVYDSGFRGLFQQYQAGARLRGLLWNLTEKQFKILVDSPCHYTGRMPSQVYLSSHSHHRQRTHGLPPKEGGTYVYNGIDRIDSAIGYTPENCVPACKDANLAKQSLSKDEFISLCREVAQHHRF
jgi:hypothetical protein